MSKRVVVTKRDPMARALGSGLFRARKVPSVRAYTRKGKARVRIEHD